MTEKLIESVFQALRVISKWKCFKYLEHNKIYIHLWQVFQSVFFLKKWQSKSKPAFSFNKLTNIVT